MADVYISFEREGVDGIVAVGSNLSDAVKRFGVRFEKKCDRANRIHFCSLRVPGGGTLLSPITETETEHFASSGRRANERLACEATIIISGEISIMTDQRNESNANGPVKDSFQAEFEALPLEKKFARLFRMEAATLSETFEFMIQQPLKVVEKMGDVIAEFGTKIETEARKAARASQPGPKPNPVATGPTEPRRRPPRKPPAPNAAKG